MLLLLMRCVSKQWARVSVLTRVKFPPRQVAGISPYGHIIFMSVTVQKIEDTLKKFDFFADDGIDKRAEAEFFKSLGSGGPIKSALEGGDDETFDKTNKILLYRYLRILFHTKETKFSFPAKVILFPLKHSILSL